MHTPANSIDSVSQSRRNCTTVHLLRVSPSSTLRMTTSNHLESHSCSRILFQIVYPTTSAQYALETCVSPGSIIWHQLRILYNLRRHDWVTIRPATDPWNHVNVYYAVFSACWNWLWAAVFGWGMEKKKAKFFPPKNGLTLTRVHLIWLAITGCHWLSLCVHYGTQHRARHCE